MEREFSNLPVSVLVESSIGRVPVAKRGAEGIEVIIEMVELELINCFKLPGTCNVEPNVEVRFSAESKKMSMNVRY